MSLAPRTKFQPGTHATKQVITLYCATKFQNSLTLDETSLKQQHLRYSEIGPLNIIFLKLLNEKLGSLRSLSKIRTWEFEEQGVPDEC